jgi:PAS domain S-box-containing protein
MKRKLALVTLATCGAALVLACGALFWFQTIRLRSSFAAELESLGAVIAYNSSAPLTFQDTNSAVEVLAALRVKPQIISAAIFDTSPKLFARYGSERTPRAPAAAPQSGVNFGSRYARLELPISDGGSRLGTLCLQADFQAEYRRLLGVYGKVLAGVLTGSLVLILTLSSLLQRVITQPITALGKVAQAIAEKQDYTVRAPSGGKDEVGLLTQAFNRMLDQIHNRERALRDANAALEQEIGERKRIEDDLRASRQRYEVAVLGSSDGLWDWDLTTSQVYFSPRWKSMLGFEDAELANDLEVYHNLLHPEDRPRALIALDDYLSGKSSSYEVEFRLQHKDGNYRWILSRGAALHDERGNPLRLAGSHTDISNRKQAEAELEKLNRQLLQTSRQAGMAEVATGVLHNVGNVLNSVNVSTTLVRENLRKSEVTSLVKVAGMLKDHSADLTAFLTAHPKGKLVPGFIVALAEQLKQEWEALTKEQDQVARNIEHIKEIVAMQQDYARVSGVLENVSLAKLVDDAIEMNQAGLLRHGVELCREYSETPTVTVDRHKVLQILTNLIHNAKYALDGSSRADKRLTLTVGLNGGQCVKVSVQDNGMGIPPENLTRIFSHGFTTRKDGHGFGLHSGANAAKEMGGTLKAQSDGPDQGATFTLELPITPAKPKAL